MDDRCQVVRASHCLPHGVVLRKHRELGVSGIGLASRGMNIRASRKISTNLSGSSSEGSQRIGRIGGSSGGNRVPSSDDDDDDDDDEKRESWFTGGERRCVLSENKCPQRVMLMIVLFSGLSVQNPNSAQRVPGGDMVSDLLRRAAEYV